MLERMLAIARTTLGTRYAAVGIANADASGFVEFLSVGVDAPEKVAHIPEGKGLFSVVLRGQLLRLDDMASHPEAAGFCDGHPPMTSLLAVPLRVEGQIGGAFYVSEDRRQLFHR